jgi:hypothetical protein
MLVVRYILGLELLHQMVTAENLFAALAIDSPEGCDQTVEGVSTVKAKAQTDARISKGQTCAKILGKACGYRRIGPALCSVSCCFDEYVYTFSHVLKSIILI